MSTSTCIAFTGSPHSVHAGEARYTRRAHLAVIIFRDRVGSVVHLRVIAVRNGARSRTRMLSGASSAASVPTRAYSAAFEAAYGPGTCYLQIELRARTVHQGLGKRRIGKMGGTEAGAGDATHQELRLPRGAAQDDDRVGARRRRHPSHREG
ncbi:hypothetical protein B0H15DRAFT_84832 [Mycena belliarum]|uniref:Uncharacterized protein n=1 Tax=Mycena belliarum TaxID=1033014 RepID=A0AAD6XID4_9AGAR|nr:hypothetical protein B0H15DRAFT_84832 [Mycena belliae]